MLCHSTQAHKLWDWAGVRLEVSPTGSPMQEPYDFSLIVASQGLADRKLESGVELGVEAKGSEQTCRGPNCFLILLFFPNPLRQHFDLNLRQFGPYRLNYSRTGR